MNLTRPGSSLSVMPLRASQVGCVTGVPAGGPGCLTLPALSNTQVVSGAVRGDHTGSCCDRLCTPVCVDELFISVGRCSGA